jgi:ABC-type multidrug transport system fused ATPase/permease subunit
MGKEAQPTESASPSESGKGATQGPQQDASKDSFTQGSATSQGGTSSTSSSAADVIARTKRNRRSYILFHVTQVLLATALLISSAMLLYGRFLNGLLVQGQQDQAMAAVVARLANALIAIVTISPQVVILMTEREWPTWWMWVDLSLAGFDVVANLTLAVFLSVRFVAAPNGDAEYLSNMLSSMWMVIPAVVMLTYAVRMYVRQAVYADVAHAKWHELHVGMKEPRVSSFLITYRACKVLLREAPLEQAGYFLCTTIASAQSPIVSMIISAAISTAPAQLQLGPVIGMLCGAIVAGQLATAGMSVLTARSFAIGCEALQRRLALKAVYGTDPNTGLLTSTFSQGLAKVQSLWVSVYWNMIFSLLQMLLQICFLATVDVIMALVVLALVQVVYTVNGLKIKASKCSIEYGQQLGEQQIALENLVALRTSARTLRAGWWLMDRWDMLAAKVRITLFQSQMLSNLYNTSFQIMGYAIYMLALSSIFVQYRDGFISQEQAFAASGYLLGIIAPVNALGSFSSRVIWSAGPVMSVYELSEEAVVVTDAKPKPRQPLIPGTSKRSQATPPSSPVTSPSRPATSPRATSPRATSPRATSPRATSPWSTGRSSVLGSWRNSARDFALRLARNSGRGPPGDAATGSARFRIPQGPRVVARDLVFQYPSATEPTLKGLCAEVQPGEYVALCGGSGSGKTTLLRLLGRANSTRSDVDSGDITVDAVPADDFPDTAFCTQSFDVLNGTVHDNITFGCEWDSLEDVQAAATLAEIAHVIERMPNGYDTVIGRGSAVTLSGGQLARLGLARSLCRRPRLLLLDEVTSPLDPEVSRRGPPCHPPRTNADANQSLCYSRLQSRPQSRRSGKSSGRYSSSRTSARSPSCSARTRSRRLPRQTESSCSLTASLPKPGRSTNSSPSVAHSMNLQSRTLVTRFSRARTLRQLRPKLTRLTVPAAALRQSLLLAQLKSLRRRCRFRQTRTPFQRAPTPPGSSSCGRLSRPSAPLVLLAMMGPRLRRLHSRSPEPLLLQAPPGASPALQTLSPPSARL